MIKSNTLPPDSIARSYIAAFVRVFVLAAFLVATMQATALASVKVTIVNRSGQTIMKGYFSYANNNKWGRDQLTKYIRPGQSHIITFNGNQRYWDCKFVLRDGSVRYKYDLDIIKTSTLYVN